MFCSVYREEHVDKDFDTGSFKISHNVRFSDLTQLMLISLLFQQNNVVTEMPLSAA